MVALLLVDSSADVSCNSEHLDLNLLFVSLLPNAHHKPNLEMLLMVFCSVDARNCIFWSIFGPENDVFAQSKKQILHGHCWRIANKRTTWDETESV